jgi:hypothetical protein
MKRDVEFDGIRSTRGVAEAARRETSMQYACLIYAEEAKFTAMTQAERDGYVNSMLDYDEELKRSGHLVASQALKTPPHAVSVRVRNGRASVTDGPFAETKEHLGGFVLIEARDLNDAIKVASDMPMARVGTIEVRPFEELSYIDVAEKEEAVR